MGNPPYNLSGSKSHGEKNSYVNFSLKAHDLLKKDGYLLFIHPPGYRIPKKIKATQVDLNAIYLSNKVHFIRMYDVPTILKLMKVMINLDYILLQKTKSGNTLTKIIGTNNQEYKVRLEPGIMVPNFNFFILDKLKKEAGKKGNLDITSRVNITTRESKEIQINSKRDIKMFTQIKKKGVKFITLKKHKQQNVPKLL